MIIILMALVLSALPGQPGVSGQSGQEQTLADTEYEILFSSEHDSRGHDLFRVGLTGEEPVKISSHVGGGHYPHHNVPTSTSEGDWIAYMSDTDGHDRYAIWIARPDGSQVKRITAPGREGLYPSWSNDGAQVAFTGRTSDGWQLFVTGRDGTGLRQVTAFTSESGPSWGMSSTWVPGENAIIFDSDSTGTWALYRVELEGGKITPLGGKRVQGRRPSLSLDGRFLAFISNRDGGNRIWVSAPDGSEARSLGVYALDYSTPAWSPTGTHIAFAAMTDENEQDIFTVEVDGGEGKYHEVYSSPGYDASPCWVRSQKP